MLSINRNMAQELVQEIGEHGFSGNIDQRHELMLPEFNVMGRLYKRRRRSAHTSLFGTRELAPQSRCSVIVAHPDDEVIGAGVLISKLSDVSVVHLTDGSPLNRRVAQEAGFEHRSEYAEARRRECVSALAIANVPADRILELPGIDYYAPFSLSNMAKRVTVFLQQFNPDIVITHPYEGGHPDHDSAAFATNAAVRLLERRGFTPPTVFEMALHPSPDGKERVLDFLPGAGRETTTLLLDASAYDLKRRMFACFATQRESLKTNPLGPEKFRRPPSYDFTVPPQSGILNYENFHGGITRDEWLILAREAWLDLFPEDARLQEEGRSH